MTDNRQFPIVPYVPHIFRHASEWRVFFVRDYAVYIEGYRLMIRAAHSHIKRLTAIERGQAQGVESC